MKGTMKIIFFITFVITTIDVFCQNYEGPSKYILYKKNGRIILAYKAFEDFLNSERSWENYQRCLLNSFPEMQYLHNRNLKYHFIDSVSFHKDVLNFSRDSFKVFYSWANDNRINELYDSIILKCNEYINPKSKIDLCLYLPYGDCFMIGNEEKQTIFISLKYSPDKMPLILCHEYAHCLHYQNRPKESESLKRYIIAEGIASYLTSKLFKTNSIYVGLWMMPKDAVNWCIEHEQDIKDLIMFELDDAGMNVEKRYIAGGAGFATPPKDFPEKQDIILDIVLYNHV